MSNNDNIIKWTPTYTDPPPPPPVAVPEPRSSSTKTSQTRTGGGAGGRTKKGLLPKRAKPKLVNVQEDDDVTSPESSPPPPTFHFASDWSPSWFPHRVIPPTTTTSTSVSEANSPGAGSGSKGSNNPPTIAGVSAGSPAATKMKKGGGGGRLAPPPAPKRSHPDLEIIRNPQYLQVSRSVVSTSAPTPSKPPPQTPSKPPAQTFLAPVVSQMKGKCKIIQPAKLQQLMKAVDPKAELERDVEVALDKYADTFLSQLLEGACQLANHRGSDNVEIGDLATYLGRHQNMKVCVGPDGKAKVKPVGNKLQLNAHCQRWELMNGTIKKY